MLEISSKTNLLEQKSYKYSLQDVAEPNLQRDIFTVGSVPKVSFNHRRVPLNMPEVLSYIEGFLAENIAECGVEL